MRHTHRNLELNYLKMLSIPKHLHVECRFSLGIPGVVFYYYHIVHTKLLILILTIFLFLIILVYCYDNIYLIFPTTKNSYKKHPIESKRIKTYLKDYFFQKNILTT